MKSFWMWIKGMNTHLVYPQGHKHPDCRLCRRAQAPTSRLLVAPTFEPTEMWTWHINKWGQSQVSASLCSCIQTLASDTKGFAWTSSKMQRIYLLHRNCNNNEQINIWNCSAKLLCKKTIQNYSNNTWRETKFLCNCTGSKTSSLKASKR